MSTFLGVSRQQQEGKGGRQM